MPCEPQTYRKLLFALAMQIVCMAGVVWGQNAPRPPRLPESRLPELYLGAFGAFGPSLEVTDLAVPAFPDCGRILNGSGSRWWLGALAELRLDDRLTLQVRPWASIHRGSLSERISGDRPVELPSGEVVPAAVDQVVDFDELSLGLTLMGRWELFQRFHVQSGLGAARLASAEQTHRQVAVSPDVLLLANNRREMSLLTGSLIPASAVQIDLRTGFTYDLPISSTSTISPELTLSLPITSRASDGSWYDISLAAGVALRFGFGASREPVPADTPRVDTPVVARRPMLVPSMATEPTTVQVRIDEYDSTEALPMLNQIFFAEGSDSLRRQYVKLDRAGAGSFSNAALIGSALDVYYQMLNVVGKRMQDFPHATLTINGYRSGREQDATLARRRAERLKRYLVDVWGIDPARIRTTGGKLPPNPSSEATPEGFAENARAELVPSDPNVTAPVLRRHIQRVATPPSVVFFPRAVAESGVSSWSIDVVEEEKTWKSFSGTGPLPDSIRWNWRSDAGSLPALPMHLSHRFTVSDATGQSAATPLSAIDVEYHSRSEKLEYRENDSTIESYSLLLFNFDSPKVSEGDRALLRAIAANVQSGAAIRLTGYTDSLGGLEHNRALAMSRAEETAKILQSLVPPGVVISVDRRGGEKERFPFDTPEGRAHCRTVIIEVRTPVSSGS